MLWHRRRVFLAVFGLFEGFFNQGGGRAGVGNRGLSTGRQRRPVGRVSGCPCPDRGRGAAPGRRQATRPTEGSAFAL